MPPTSLCPSSETTLQFASTAEAAAIIEASNTLYDLIAAEAAQDTPAFASGGEFDEDGVRMDDDIFSYARREVSPPGSLNGQQALIIGFDGAERAQIVMLTREPIGGGAFGGVIGRAVVNISGRDTAATVHGWQDGTRDAYGMGTPREVFEDRPMRPDELANLNDLLPAAFERKRGIMRSWAERDAPHPVSDLILGRVREGVGYILHRLLRGGSNNGDDQKSIGS